MKLTLVTVIPILYLILVVLIAVGVVPLYFYATKMVVRNRETLGRNEKLLQNMVTTTLAQSIALREKEISATLASLAYSIGHQRRRTQRHEGGSAGCEGAAAELHRSPRLHCSLRAAGQYRKQFRHEIECRHADRH